MPVLTHTIIALQGFSRSRQLDGVRLLATGGRLEGVGGLQPPLFYDAVMRFSIHPKRASSTS